MCYFFSGFSIIKFFCSNMLNNRCANNNFDEIRKLHLEHKAQRSIWFPAAWTNYEHNHCDNIETFASSGSATLSFVMFQPKKSIHIHSFTYTIDTGCDWNEKECRVMFPIRSFAIYYMLSAPSESSGKRPNSAEDLDTPFHLYVYRKNSGT